METNKSFLDLPPYIKEARELAVLGKYHKSIATYSKIIHIIEQRLREVATDKYLVDKWRNTRETLRKECALILEAYEICKTFQKDEAKEKIKEESLKNNQVIMRDYKSQNKKMVFNNNDYNQPRNNAAGRWDHFNGQKPFEYLKYRNSMGNSSEYKSTKNYVQEIDPIGADYVNNLYKDPDVWEDPENDPRFPYQRDYVMPRRARQGSAKRIEKLDLHVIDEKELERKRNYDKPWKVPAYTKPKENNPKGKKTLNKKNNKDDKPLKNEKPKSAFLLARYPQDKGNGPDTDLIESIEREIIDFNPNKSFDDVAELEVAKRALTEAVVLPLLMPDFFVGLRRPWKGVLLYGPPGTGKTLLAQALATQGKTTFFNVAPTTFASKWKGESEKLVRILFEMARFYAPSTIFIDEVDSIGTKRRSDEHEASKKMLAEMLVQMDGISDSIGEELQPGEKPKFVMVLGATNLPWDLDDALRRRFEKRIYIPLPNSVGRIQMFNIFLKGIKLDNDVNIEALAKKTEGYSGADIYGVCKDASMMNMRRRLLSNKNDNFNILDVKNDESFMQVLEAPVKQQDILTAIKNVQKSVGNSNIKKFEEWTKQYSNK